MRITKKSQHALTQVVYYFNLVYYWFDSRNRESNAIFILSTVLLTVNCYVLYATTTYTEIFAALSMFSVFSFLVTLVFTALTYLLNSDYLMKLKEQFDGNDVTPSLIWIDRIIWSMFIIGLLCFVSAMFSLVLTRIQ